MANENWRVGSKLGRTLYRDGICVGMVDSPEIAAEIVEAMDAVRARSANSVLVPADQLKALQDERDRLKAQAIEARALITTAATFLLCDPDAVDTALVKEYGMISEDTRSFVEIIRAHLRDVGLA